MPKNPPWTPSDLELVRQWQSEGVPGKEQAERLNRTYVAWKTAVNYYGLGKCRFWTAKEVQLVRQWQEQGVPGEEQARRLGRPYFAWKSAVSRYKLCGEHHTGYDVDVRALIMEKLPLGWTQADIVRTLNLKTHTFIGRVTRSLIKQGLLVRTSRVKKRWKYEATPKWLYGRKDDTVPSGSGGDCGVAKNS